MATAVTLKVYTKEDKLKVLVSDSTVIKTVSIYKYNGENIDIHSFTYAKEGELKSWQAYYELTVEVDGDLKECVVVSEGMMEYREYTNDMNMIRTITNLKSGNVYEKRIKYFEGEKYEADFLNDQFHEIETSVRFY